MPHFDIPMYRGYWPNPSPNPWDYCCEVPAAICVCVGPCTCGIGPHQPPCAPDDCCAAASETAVFPTVPLSPPPLTNVQTWTVSARENVKAFGNVIRGISYSPSPDAVQSLIVRVSTQDLKTNPLKVQVNAIVMGAVIGESGTRVLAYHSSIKPVSQCSTEIELDVPFGSNAYDLRNDADGPFSTVTIFVMFG